MANQDTQSLIDIALSLLREIAERVANFDVIQLPDGEVRIEIWLEKPTLSFTTEQLVYPIKSDFDASEFKTAIRDRKPYPFVCYASNADGWFTVKNGDNSVFFHRILDYITDKKYMRHSDAYAIWEEDDISFVYYPINSPGVENLIPINAYHLRD
jgi:hypothetical protein